MPVSTLDSAEEFEEKGWADIEFVGFRYIGPESITTNRDIRQRAGYNGPAKFQRGRVYFALLPTNLNGEHVANSEMSAAALEARGDFEVIYDPERLTEALLERNYLPPDVFYEGFDLWKRQHVMDKLGLEDLGRIHERADEAPYREALRELAGVESDDEAAVSQQRAESYTDRFSRSELVAIVDVLQPHGPGTITLDSAGLTECAEYLTLFDAGEVEQAVDVALGEADADDLDVDSVGDDANTDAAGEEPHTVPSPPVNPTDLTVDELQAELSDRSHGWTLGKLLGLAAAETDGDNRTTAIEAIRDKYEALGGEVTDAGSLVPPENLSDG